MGKTYESNSTNGWGFSYNFTLSKPMDTRLVVNTFDNLTELATWNYKDSYYVYSGMAVACADTGKIYVYKGETGNAEDIQIASNWVAQGADVVNDLETDNSTKALSAAQGKKLNDSLTALQEEINKKANQSALEALSETVTDNKSEADAALEALTEDMEVGTDENDNPKKATIANAIQYALDKAIYDALNAKY